MKQGTAKPVQAMESMLFFLLSWLLQKLCIKGPNTFEVFQYVLPPIK